jgi:hypothetical protein
MDSFNSTIGQENLTAFDQDLAKCATETQLPVSPSFLNLGSQAYLMELLPMAAYAVRAPDGVIAWFNSRAAELWGRVPEIGDTDERFCGAYKLYRPDGSFMAHCDTPVALALSSGNSTHEEEVVIEKSDGRRVSVCVHIDPIRDENGGIIGAVNFFHDITERKQKAAAGSTRPIGAEGRRADSIFAGALVPTDASPGRRTPTNQPRPPRQYWPTSCPGKDEPTSLC